MKGIKIKLISAILIFIFIFNYLVTLSPVFATNSNEGQSLFAGGTGTAEDPYLIETATQLDAIRNDLTASYKLIDDIDLTYDTANKNGLFYNNGNGWISIDGVFSGSLDGNNKTILGMTQQRTFEETNSNGLNNAGLFVNVSGTIENLILKEININYSEKTNVGVTIGGIAANASGSILNTTVTGNIMYNGEMGNLSSYSPYSIGGIIGYPSSNIEINNCINETNITVDSSIDGDLGGITTSVNNSGLIISCINRGNIITNGQDAGGIASSLGDETNIIKNCKNYGTITADYVGGIVGTLSGGKVLLSANFGTINSRILGGGIVSLSIMNSSVEKSYNSGSVNTFESITDGTPGVGGIAGTSYATIKDCYNIGLINDEKGVNLRHGSIGGIVGTATGTITNTYNIGRIKSTNKETKIGNLVGTNNSKLTNSYYYDNGLPSVGEQNNEYINEKGEDNSTKLTSDKIKKASSYVGFDFENIWNMNKNTTYPLPQINNNDLEGKYLKNINLKCDDKVYIGDKIKIDYELLPNDTLYKNVVWSVVSGTGEGTITSDGMFVGTKTGTVTIVATSEELPFIIGTLEIEVLPIATEKIEINENISTVSLNNKYTFTATINPTNATNKNVVWSVVNGTGEGTITSEGMFMGIKTGTVTIVATSEDNTTITDSIEVEIIGVDIKGIQIKADSLYVDTGSSFYLQAFVAPSNTSVKEVVWSSSDTSIATINAETGGVSTKYKKGIVTFTATSTINSEIKGSITIYVGYTNIKLGEETSLGNSSFTTYEEVIWEIENEDILEPTGRTGSTSVNSYYRHYIYVKGKSNGETTITMKTISGDVLAKTVVRVYTPINNISYSSEKLFIGAGDQKKLDIEITPTNISENLDKLIYYSEDSSIAEVDTDGNVFAKSVGNTNITVYSQYYNKKIIIPVCVETYPTSIYIENSNIMLTDENRSYKVEYTILPENATNKKIIFTSGDISIASVNQDGVITALKNGIVKIIVKNANNDILKELNVTISGLKTDISKFNVSGIQDVVYDGTEKKLDITINDGTYSLIENIDYEIKYENNLNVGKANVIIKGINYFKGTINLTFNINPATIEYTVSGKTVTYDSKKYGITIDLITQGVDLKFEDKNGNYTLTEMPKYSNAGTYKIKFKLSKDNYKTIESMESLIINKANFTYTSYDREDFVDEYESMTSSDYDNVLIHVDAPKNDYEIKFADENGNYTLTTAPFVRKAGDYLIKYQISGANYNTVTSSFYRHHYGIKKLHTSLEIRDCFLVIKDYTTNINSISNKFTFHSKPGGFTVKHMDGDNGSISKELTGPVKTGDFINIFANLPYSLQMHWYIAIVLGDVNGDGKISALDYVKVKNHIMSTNYLSSSQANIAADANDDGKISALDYVRIKNYIMNGGN